MSLSSEEIIAIYKRIDFQNRYEKLSNSYQFEERLEYSNDSVIKLLEELDYRPKYIRSNNFFKIEDTLGDIKFNLNINLKYSNVESIIGATNLKTKEFLLGDVFGGICKDIEIFESQEKEGFVKKPKFRNYSDLQEILVEIVSIYEDFKYEILKIEEINYEKKELSKKSTPIIDVERIDDGRSLIYVGSNEKELYTKTHILEFEGHTFSFLIDDSKSINSLNKELDKEFFQFFLMETNAKKNIFDDNDSLAGLSLRYLIKENYLLIISSGEVQPGLFKLYVERCWKFMNNDKNL